MYPVFSSEWDRLRSRRTALVRQSADDFRAYKSTALRISPKVQLSFRFVSVVVVVISRCSRPLKNLFWQKVAQKNTDGSAGPPSGGKSCYNQVILLLGAYGPSKPVSGELIIELPIIKGLPPRRDSGRNGGGFYY
mgnify:CR=1 FL=1